jgi:hypothetical protein
LFLVLWLLGRVVLSWPVNSPVYDAIHKHSSPIISESDDLMNLGFSFQLAEVDQNARKRLMAKSEFADKMQMRVLRLDMESAAGLFREFCPTTCTIGSGMS